MFTWVALQNSLRLGLAVLAHHDCNAAALTWQHTGNFVKEQHPLSHVLPTSRPWFDILLVQVIPQLACFLLGAFQLPLSATVVEWHVHVLLAVALENLIPELQGLNCWAGTSSASVLPTA